MDKLRTIQEKVSALEERISALEATASSSQHSADSSERETGDRFWALNGLRSRLPDHPDTAAGAVMLVGALTLPDGSPVEWQQGAGASGMLETDWSEQSTVFAALGHPVRLELLRHILSGTRTTAELSAIDGLGTTGQLHHHLRQLIAAGWVRQSGRGIYEVPAARIVPLLAGLVGAQR